MVDPVLMALAIKCTKKQEKTRLVRTSLLQYTITKPNEQLKDMRKLHCMLLYEHELTG